MSAVAWCSARRPHRRRAVTDAIEEQGGPARQPLWFLILLALAVAGGAISYVPFLTVLLPLRITELSGGADVAALSYLTFGGAIMASVANISFGWLSDRTRSRRAWIFAGLLLSGGMLASMGRPQDVTGLLAMVLVWQLGLNMMLAPLNAWAGDCVPDAQKGLLGGLFAFAPALGALSGALITIPGLAGPDARLAMVVGLVVVMVMPALLLGKNRALPELTRASMGQADMPQDRFKTRRSISRMWFARLLVQVSEAALFAFLLFWLRSMVPDFGEDKAAQIFSLVLVIAVPIALVAGRWSDRVGRPMFPLAVCAGLSSIGLLVMAFAATIELALAGYVVFGITSMTFLSLHSSQTLRVLPRPETRGRDLGFFNLTNTVPSLIIPGLTLALVPRFGFDALFVLLAALSALAALLIGMISRRM